MTPYQMSIDVKCVVYFRREHDHGETMRGLAPMGEPKESPANIKLQVYVDAETKAEWESFAKSKKTSISGMVKIVVTETIEAAKRK